MVEAWVPHLKVERLIVADDEASANPLMRAAMTMAVPSNVEVRISRIDQTDFAALAKDDVRSLVLLRDIAAALAARRQGLPDGPLNIGNVHAGMGRVQVTRSVFLTGEERIQLSRLAVLGMPATVQSVPSESPIAILD